MASLCWNRKRVCWVSKMKGGTRLRRKQLLSLGYQYHRPGYCWWVYPGVSVEQMGWISILSLRFLHHFDHQLKSRLPATYTSVSFNSSCAFVFLMTSGDALWHSCRARLASFLKTGGIGEENVDVFYFARSCVHVISNAFLCFLNFRSAVRIGCEIVGVKAAFTW